MTSVFSPLKKKEKKSFQMMEKFNANPKSSLSLLEVHDVDAEDLHVELRYRSISEDHMKEAGGFIDDWEEKNTYKDVGCLQRILLWFSHKLKETMLAPRNWIFLSLIGVMTATLTFFFEVVLKYVKKIRLSFEVLYFWIAYPSVVLFAIVMALISVACTMKLSAYAKGSGMPEIKTILSGTQLSGPLSIRCFFAKLIGLICALSGGMSIGREGPFIHMSCIFAYNLTRLPYFSSIRKQERMLRQMLAAAVSAGITAVFGSPIGGVLFGIEITATYYMVNNLWRSFFAAVICIFVSKLYNLTQESEIFSQSSFASDPSIWIGISYCIVGAIGGYAGAKFVKYVEFIQLRVLYKYRHWSGYFITAMVAGVTALISFPIPFMNVDDVTSINELFKASSLITNSAMFSYPTMWVNLPAFFIMKFILTGISITLPISCGLYTPIFALGAVLGRFIGELICLASPGTSPAGFAIVGAAAMASGATHTVSTAVIILELTGQMNHMLPVLLSVLIARSVASTYTISIYDLFSSIGNLPFLADAKVTDLYGRMAIDIMDRNPLFLTMKSTRKEAYSLLLATIGKSTYEEIAIVDPADLGIIGSVSRINLSSAIDKVQKYSRMATRLDYVSSEKGGNRWKQFQQYFSDLVYDFKQSLNASGIAEDFTELPSDLNSEKDLHNNIYFEQFMNEKIEFSVKPSDNEQVKIDLSPFSIFDETRLSKVHFIFAITNWPVLFVCREGRFVGLIGKNDIATDAAKSKLT